MTATTHGGGEVDDKKLAYAAILQHLENAERSLRSVRALVRLLYPSSQLDLPLEKLEFCRKCVKITAHVVADKLTCKTCGTQREKSGE